MKSLIDTIFCNYFSHTTIICHIFCNISFRYNIFNFPDVCGFEILVLFSYLRQLTYVCVKMLNYHDKNIALTIELQFFSELM